MDRGDQNGFNNYPAVMEMQVKLVLAVISRLYSVITYPEQQHGFQHVH